MVCFITEQEPMLSVQEDSIEGNFIRTALALFFLHFTIFKVIDMLCMLLRELDLELLDLISHLTYGLTPSLVDIALLEQQRHLTLVLWCPNLLHYSLEVGPNLDLEI